ncbi:sensor domain-containing diguanylate cyclase [Niallia sp. Krafla_26]|uniref:sensor domain-containing diguanylate cyclase n=1 Tax=Niallia sp. Krafla_26 TaxID=3064703 RepID=UPI003D1661E0
MVEERFILHIKARFYDIATTDISLPCYDSILMKMVAAIHDILNVNQVMLCAFQNNDKKVFIEASASSDLMLNPSEIDVSTSNSSIHSFEKTSFFGWSIPVIQQDYSQRLLLLVDKDSRITTLSIPFLQTLREICGDFLEKVTFQINLVSEQKRYKQLLRVTEKVHSTMNMESVLNEIIESLREIYPSFTYYLLLSQDHEGYEGLPIKEFDYGSKNNSLMEAYVTGNIQFEDSLAEKTSILYAPLKGKQGVYGVLQMIAPDSLIFPKNEVEFISLLAKTAGEAMENAQLYEQSRRLIADLQLINETSQQLNSNLRLTETMQYMSEQIILSLGAEEVGFIQITSKMKDMKVQIGSTDFFFTFDAAPYIEYSKNRIIHEHESLFIGELILPLQNTQPKAFKSMMVVPMLQAGDLNGFVIVLHQEPYAFSFETFKLLKSLVQHSTLAFTNTLLREELEKMVITDHLTKLYSRSYLDEKIKESMSVDAEGTFIMIDIDNFKRINDTYGHQIGDEVIIQVAEIIQSNIRSTDVGARWGGEELAIYLPRVSLETGIHIAERLVKKVRESSNPKITVSCGVSHWKKEDNDTYTTLFKRADQALYEAKETGKDKVVTQP